MHDDYDDEPEIVPLTLSQKAAIAASSALVTVGLPALWHAPLPLEVAGLAGAIALAAKSPELCGQVRAQAPWLDRWLATRREEARSER